MYWFNIFNDSMVQLTVPNPHKYVQVWNPTGHIHSQFFMPQSWTKYFKQTLDSKQNSSHHVM